MSLGYLHSPKKPLYYVQLCTALSTTNFRDHPVTLYYIDFRNLHIPGVYPSRLCEIYGETFRVQFEDCVLS